MHELSSPYNPRSNGHAEATVKNMKYLLENHHAHWDTFKEALLECRNTPRPDNLSPAQLMTGHRQRTMQPAHPAAYKHICTGPPPPPQGDTKSRWHFSPGDKVFLQCPHSKHWDATGSHQPARVMLKQMKAGHTSKTQSSSD